MSRNKEDHVGPENMSHELYIFADAYFFGRGKERTYRSAAIKAGAKKNSAHTLGHKWSKYTVVRDYWKSLEESYTLARKAIHMRSLERMEDLALKAHKEPVDNFEQIFTVENFLTDKTTSVFEAGDIEHNTVESTGTPSVDEATKSTMFQITESIKAISGDHND